MNESGRNDKLPGGGGWWLTRSDSAFSHVSRCSPRLYPSQSICEGYGGRRDSIRIIGAGRLVFQFPTPPPRKNAASSCASLRICSNWHFFRQTKMCSCGTGVI